MSLSPRKHTNHKKNSPVDLITNNDDYLNFIRKNHLQLEKQITNTISHPQEDERGSRQSPKETGEIQPSSRATALLQRREDCQKDSPASQYHPLDVNGKGNSEQKKFKRYQQIEQAVHCVSGIDEIPQNRSIEVQGKPSIEKFVKEAAKNKQTLQSKQHKDGQSKINRLSVNQKPAYFYTIDVAGNINDGNQIKSSSSVRFDHLKTSEAADKLLNSNPETLQKTLANNDIFIDQLMKKNRQIANKLLLQEQKKKAKLGAYFQEMEEGKSNVAQRKQRKPVQKKEVINMKDVWREKSKKRYNSNKEFRPKKGQQADALEVSNNILVKDSNSSGVFANRPVYSELQLPSISAKEININKRQMNKSRDSSKSRTKKNLKNLEMTKNSHQSKLPYDMDIEYENCKIITRSKPIISKLNANKHLEQYQKYFDSLECNLNQEMNFMSHEKLQSLRSAKLEIEKLTLEMGHGLLSRQRSIENYGSIVSDSPYSMNSQSVKNNSVSMLKRRRNVPQKLTNFLSSNPKYLKYTSTVGDDGKPEVQRIEKKKATKQQMKVREQQFEQYLMENSILKSSKIFNYYEKQEEKKKMLFNQLQMNYYQSPSGGDGNSGKSQIFNSGSEQLGLENDPEKWEAVKVFQKDGLKSKVFSMRDEGSQQKGSAVQMTDCLGIEKSQILNVADFSTSARSYLLQRQPASKKQGQTSQVNPSPIQKNFPSLRKQADLTIYEAKIKSYKQFLLLVNFSHKLFHPISFKPSSQFKTIVKFRYFIGKGNNRLLIKSLMKKRFWWEETDKIEKANFAWTQLKVNKFYQYQKVSDYFYRDNKFDKHPNLLQNQNEEEIDKISDKSVDSEQAEEQNKQRKKPKEKKKIHKKSEPKSSQHMPQSKAGSFKPLFLQNPSHTKILTEVEKKQHEKFMSDFECSIPKGIEANKMCIPDFDKSFKEIKDDSYLQKIHNHLEFNFYIGNKKALFYNLRNYYKLQGKYAFDIAIPYTLHIKKGMSDPAYQQFLKQFKKIQQNEFSESLGTSTNPNNSKKSKNIWIVKPGELSNRGNGITVIDEIYELNSILKKKEKHSNGAQKSYILQKYIEKPLLYKGRKFDIRHFMLIERISGRLRAYWYGEGYIRTSSYEYKLDELDEMIHLTNDAIQNQQASYGRHQEGNKISYNQFQRYLDTTFGENKISFVENIYPKMREIALDSVKATYLQMDTRCLEHNFELLGLDFMIDSNLKVWLIEVNTNPCLELSAKILERIIPQAIEHTMRLTIDPLFPPPVHYPNSLKHLCPDNPLERLQYELIFDQARDGQQVEALFKGFDYQELLKEMGQVDEEDVVFQNDGKQLDLSSKDKGTENLD